MLAELGFAVLVAAALVAANESLDAHPVSATLEGNRGAFYGALAALWGGLLGFSITAISIVLVMMDDERLKLLRESTVSDDLWNVFISALHALALATVTALLALLLDRDQPFEPSPLWMYLSLFTSLLAAFRVGRVIWALEGLIRIIGKRPRR